MFASLSVIGNQSVRSEQGKGKVTTESDERETHDRGLRES